MVIEIGENLSQVLIAFATVAGVATMFYFMTKD